MNNLAMALADVPQPRETDLQLALSLVEQALACVRTPARGRVSGEAVQVLDVGTGSGCVAVTLALEAPSVRVLATDVSAAALRIAEANAKRLNAAGRVEFRVASLAGDFPAGFDLVVANPPYVPEADRESLAPEVRDHEPSGALFAGPDGLDDLHRIIDGASDWLMPGGALVVEIDPAQADAVSARARAAGLVDVAIVDDLSSRARAMRGRRPA